MLELKSIKKEYALKGQPSVKALKGVSLNFRRNEFVAILGASGCGKTTLLNIIGGLDRYTSGDLVIKGKSTKNYGDRDWDTYRNHSVGFIFQSYNLITHQSILKNVELALTISGVSKAERKQRALEAIEKVGLKDHVHKRPNQLSGGQMQRVAIARALVNNPEILLADEPTGALDSETSIQVMDLLKEVASDRLVIMVTHNPELAYKYASRIVSMKDGTVLDDTMPFEGETLREKRDGEKLDAALPTKGSKKKTSMSFATAAALSFSNLLSKAKRTVLVTIAGSIGIIGVSAVLAVSTGVNDYIDTMQDDMLSSYPLSIRETSVDYMSLMTGLSSWSDKKIADFDLTTSVGLDSMITYLMDKYADITSVKTNDINEDLLRYLEAAPEEYSSAMLYDYGIDMTNNIFTSYTLGKRVDGTFGEEKMMSLNGLTQMYISELQTVENFGEYAMFVDLFTDFLKPFPADANHVEYISEQYDLVGTGSRFPTGDNEIVLVVDDNQTLTDILYAQLGFYSEQEFLDIAREAINEHDDNIKPDGTKKYSYPDSFTFDEILGKKLAYYPHDDIYSFDSIEENQVKFDINIDEKTTLRFKLVYNEDCDCLIGTLGTSSGSISCILVRPEGTPEGHSSAGKWSWSSSLTEQPLEFNLVPGASESDSNLVWMRIEVPGNDPADYPVTTYTSELNTTKAYMYEGVAKDTWAHKEEVKIVGILKKKPNINFGCLSRGAYYTQEFANKYINQNKDSKIIRNKDTLHPEQNGLATYIKENNAREEEAFQTYVKYDYTSFIKGELNPVYDVFGYANALNGGGGFAGMMSMGQRSAYDTDKANLRSLAGLSSKMVKGEVEGLYDYAFEPVPSSISIYPQDFKAKDKMTEYLDAWNKEVDITLPKTDKYEEKVLKFEDREELTYSDTVELIITAINTLITTITVALISFTSLSLVVSCFMIAVITYISVVERTKEIGVIRSLGGRKRDVSRLFIAETFMTGLLSGSFGVAITYIFQIVFNIALFASFGIANMANLTIVSALVMISISILLSVISGFVPSMKASNQDPVLALRSEWELKKYMKKVGLISLGCAKNRVDSENILGLLDHHKYQVVNSVNDADILIINTCGFISESKKESIDTILEFIDSGKKIVVTGCLAERYLEELKKELPEVDLFVPIRDYYKFNELLSTIDDDLDDKSGLNDEYRLVSTGSFSAYLKIGEGCSNGCSYCAIPLIRGGFHSRPFNDIIKEAKHLASIGYKEIIVLQQDTTKYGIDLKENKNIVDLLKELLKIEEFNYIRLLYLYPDEITDELIELIGKEERLTPYFDVPIQYSESKILRLMNRRGDKKFLKNLFKKIREKVPNAVLRTTIMVGFPGETSKDFNNLLEFVKEVKFDHLGAFKYSREEDTKSYNFPHQVRESTKEKRHAKLMKLQQSISYRKHKEHLNEVMNGLVVGKEKDLYLLRSYFNAPDDVDGKIFFKSKNNLKLGQKVKVKITETFVYDLLGEEVE